MSTMVPGNVKVNRMCAFCKYWYDPANSAIEPKSTSMGIWLYDREARKKCLQCGLIMSARASCKKYQCKI